LLRVSRQPDGRPEIFHSIQGEGIYAGRPAVFLRLALCNLACVWCDTRYTWDWGHHDREKEMVVLSPADAEQAIGRFGCRSLVVTGGEPMLQQTELVGLLERLKSVGFWIEVETNGTILPDERLPGVIDHWSVSPKLESSGNPPSLREKPEAYRVFSRLPSAHFKYVVDTPDDVAEVGRLSARYEIPRGRIALMPQATGSAALLEKSRWLADTCRSEGFLFSTRLQVLLWGNRRGV
jgi:7-carboxy-7-deazaguanine synthase